MTPVLLFVDLVAKVSNSGVKCPLTDSPGPVKSKRPTPDNQLGMSRVNKQTVNVHTHYIRCEHCSPEWLPPTGERQVILSTQQVSEGVPTLRYWSGG